jgi:uncharacterized OB-fold protein
MTLEAPYVFEYSYRRSVGPVIGRFLAGLREARFFGLRLTSGRVLAPPSEFDPDTGEPAGGDWVEVGPLGTVVTWTWEGEPRRGQPLGRPFAWALVRLDRADTAILHALDAASPRTGMRVRPRWRPERIGAITDLACFEELP